MSKIAPPRPTHPALSPATPCHRYFSGMAESPVRNPAVDFYRVSGVVLIVLGHWLAGAVTYRDGVFGRQNPLVDQPWTQWLTWPFQAVPAFFLVAGYAAAVSWSHRCATEGVSRQTWVRHRLARVLGPSAVYVVLVSVVVAVFEASGVTGSTLEYAGWAVAMHLWFLAVYLVVVSLTPIAIAAQRRWGLLVPAVAGGGRRGRRRCLAGRPRAVSGLAELSAVLGAALPTRNSLAERGFSWVATRNACRRIGVCAVAVDLAGPLPGQHDRRSRPGRAEHRATVGGNAGVRLCAGRAGDQRRARAQPRAAGRFGSASVVASQHQCDGACTCGT